MPYGNAPAIPAGRLSSARALGRRRHSWPGLLHTPDSERPLDIGHETTGASYLLARATHIQTVCRDVIAVQSTMQRQYALLVQHNTECRHLEREMSALVEKLARHGSLHFDDIDRLKALNNQHQLCTRSREDASEDIRASSEKLAQSHHDLQIRVNSLSMGFSVGMLDGGNDWPHLAFGDESGMETSEAQDETDDEPEIPALLQAFYDAAGWIGVLRERLEDLQCEHYERLEKKRKRPNITSLNETRSDRQFKDQETDMQQQLRAAKEKTRSLLEECNNQGIDVPYSAPLSSNSHSSTSRSSRSSFDEAAPETAVPSVQSRVSDWLQSTSE